jgi:hypothetical protein
MLSNMNQFPGMLLGLRDAPAVPAGPHQDQIATLLLTYPTPSSANVSDFLKPFASDERTQVAQELIANGVDAHTVSSAMAWLDTQSKIKGSSIWGVLSIASAALSGYHGYKRNNSLGWGIAWFTLGGLFPVITPTIALAQGLGKRKGA